MADPVSSSCLPVVRYQKTCLMREGRVRQGFSEGGARNASNGACCWILLFIAVCCKCNIFFSVDRRAGGGPCWRHASAARPDRESRAKRERTRRRKSQRPFPPARHWPAVRAGKTGKRVMSRKTCLRRLWDILRATGICRARGAASCRRQDWRAARPVMNPPITMRNCHACQHRQARRNGRAF